MKDPTIVTWHNGKDKKGTIQWAGHPPTPPPTPAPPVPAGGNCSAPMYTNCGWKGESFVCLFDRTRMTKYFIILINFLIIIYRQVTTLGIFKQASIIGRHAALFVTRRTSV